MNEQILHHFKQSVLKKRVSHLYLLLGPKGTGKEILAKKMAHMLISKTEDEHIFYLIDKEEHSNFFHIKKDGLSVKKQQILDLQEEFSKTSLQDGARVYVISDIETMSISAANSLLKFMEEPQNSQTYGFLLAKDSDQVLPTIISRSQVIKLSQPKRVDVMHQFIRQDITAFSASILALLTNNVDEAVTLSTDERYLELEHMFESVTTHLLDLDYILPIEMNAYRNLLNTDRFYLTAFLTLMLHYVMDLNHAKGEEPIYFENLSSQIELQASKVSQNNILKLAQALKNSILKLEANISIDLMIDLLSVQLSVLRKEMKQ